MARRIVCPKCGQDPSAILETLYASAYLVGPVIEGEDLPYAGESDVHWDSQVPYAPDGRRTFTCDDCGDFEVDAEPPPLREYEVVSQRVYSHEATIRVRARSESHALELAAEAADDTVHPIDELLDTELVSVKLVTDTDKEG